MATALTASDRALIDDRLRQFGDWAPGEPAPPRLIGALGGGLSNRVLLLRGAADHYVLRLGRAQPGPGVCRQREVVAHAAAAAAGVAPALYWADPDTGALIMEFIDSAPQTPVGPPTDRDAGDLEAMARLLRDIHRLPCEGPELDVAQLLRSGGPAADNAPYRAAPWFDEALRAIADGCGAAPVLCHNDLLGANRLARNGRLLAVDWEYAALADPLQDLAVCASELTTGDAQRLLQAYLGRSARRDEEACFRARRILYACLEYDWYRREQQPGMDPAHCAQRLRVQLQRAGVTL